MLRSTEIKTLVNRILVFIKQNTHHAAQAGVPYLHQTDIEEPMDFFQGVRLYGKYNGLIGFSMTQVMFQQLAEENDGAVVGLNSQDAPLEPIMTVMLNHLSEKLGDQVVVRPLARSGLGQYTDQLQFLIIPIIWQGFNSRIFISFESI